MNGPPLQPAVPDSDASAGAAKEFALVGFAAFALYLATMAPGVLWQDNGLAQVRVLRGDLKGSLGLALSHPLFYAVAGAAQSLPFTESAFKTNLVAAFFGALTVANVYGLLRLVTGRAIPALVGATSLAVAHTFWQHCAMAEVYSLNSALLALELTCLFRFCVTDRPVWLVVLFLFNGLGVSNHMLAVLSLACYVVFLAVLLARRRLAPRWLLLFAVAWLGGAGLYLGMIVSEIASGAGWMAALRSACFGTIYRHNVLNLAMDLSLLKRSALYLALNFPTPVVLLVPLALASLWRTPAGSFRLVLLALTAVHLLWAMRYNVSDQYTFFFLAVVLLAIWIGLGADVFLWNRGRASVVLVLAAAAIPPLVYAPLPRIARAAGFDIGVARAVPYRDEYVYFLHPWKTGYRGPEQFARRLIDELPTDAVLLADTTTLRPLDYFRLTGRWRSDVAVFSALDVPSADCSRAFLDQAIAGSRLFVVSATRGYVPDWLFDRYDFEPAAVVFRVKPRAGHPASSPFEAGPR